ncbi:hypothetical protein [Neobacillus notoginsengisoli]|uniref:hypothetical protein n=1 Tax=Neobacillus notoginsengisoli TaxID=1578198 RepID=UPI001314EB9D|nr:hypothetical protein [Neobacillus notoginsengisoli]
MQSLFEEAVCPAGCGGKVETPQAPKRRGGSTDAPRKAKRLVTGKNRLETGKERLSLR